MLSTTRIVISTLAVFLMSLCDVSPAFAQGTTGIQQVPMGGAVDVTMPLYKSRIISVAQPTGRVAVGNPDVADIVVISPTQLYVLAKDIGTTNMLFWGRDGRLLGSVNLEVAHDLEGLKAKLHQLLPDEPIEIYSAQRNIVLKGRASNVMAMNAAVRIAEGYLAQIQTAKKTQQFEQQKQAMTLAAPAGGKRGTESEKEDQAVGSVINLIEIAGAQQVMLSVKVAEIQRTELKRMNANLTALWMGSDGNFGISNGGGIMNSDGSFLPNPLKIINQGFFGAFIDDDFKLTMALDVAKENGLAKILAEPTLATLTGQEAEFLSGGEFPVPVPQGGTFGGITVEFKPYGVGLKFLPVVLSDGRINLKVNVSVSELAGDSSIVLSSSDVSTSMFVPSLRRRSASATVELGDGQSMGLAGLLDDKLRESVTKFPGLGDIPVLGALFRSNDYQKGQTELVIMVTPHLAKPVAAGSVKLPTDAFVEPNDVDFYLMGRTEGKAKATSGGHQVN
ncbi:MAG: type II and III secretion system protein family protein [Gammaproteobacteria bacterium]|nr:type II and III secretion system protein family protein [Gammaproteobacteria bacterium]